MGRFMATYRVRARNQESEYVALVRASDSKRARDLARPSLMLQGVDPNDPLVVEQLTGRAWDPDVDAKPMTVDEALHPSPLR